MTIIVAVSRPDLGYTAIGCDLYTTGGNDRVERGPCKWVQIAPRCAIGVTGMLRALNVLLVQSTKLLPDGGVPAHPDLAWATRCATNIRGAFLEDKFKADETPGRNASINMQAVLAAGPALFEIDPGFAVVPVEPGRPFCCGSGGEYALGAAWMLKKLKEKVGPATPELTVDLLLQAAQLSPGCGAEHWIGRVEHATPATDQEPVRMVPRAVDETGDEIVYDTLNRAFGPDYVLRPDPNGPGARS